MNCRLLFIVLAVSLSGCGTAKMFDNRAVCTVSGDKAYAVSLWGPVGISAELNTNDADVLCQAPRSQYPFKPIQK